MTKKEMKRREELKKSIIKREGFEKSRYPGIFYSPDKQRRIKFTRLKVRYEVKGYNRWVLVKSEYYKNL